jgi:hypothetical protein
MEPTRLRATVPRGERADSRSNAFFDDRDDDRHDSFDGEGEDTSRRSIVW